MVDVREKYPQVADGTYGVKNGPSYDGICALFGTVLLKSDQDDYQGDSLVLIQNGERYGVLKFGWGSCSGCDALEGADTVKELQELVDELEASVKWFDKEGVIEYLSTHDWRGDYSWHYKELREFPNKALAALGSDKRISEETD